MNPSLQFSERRPLLILGDLLTVTLTGLFALGVWALRAGKRFTWARIVSQVEWLLLLPTPWLLLAAINDLRNLHLVSRLSSNGVALLRTTALLLPIYLVLFHTTNLDFQAAEWNSTSEAEKAHQGLISALESAFQLQTRISNPRPAIAIVQESQGLFREKALVICSTVSSFVLVGL